jgi:glucose/arabinose dehydrogenase
MSAGTRTRAVAVGGLLAAVLAVTTGCSGGSSSGVASTAPVPQSGSLPTPSLGETPTDAPAVTVVKTLATGLQVPWGVAFMPDGSALVAERPSGRIDRISPDGAVRPIGVVPGVADRGEGGLLGLAVLPSAAGLDAPVTVFAYLTSVEGDNRVIRMSYDGVALGKPVRLLTGIPASDHHNGGLLAIGPDSKLWIGTGDAGVTSRAQDRASLGGKILRINLGGSIPSDNPFPDSPVYSLGHRNVQGLAFDSAKQPWAVEFGQDTWDELNRIVPGGNYGWPVVEGQQPHAGFIEPLVQWRTDDASPSGMAIVRDVAYIGGLRGERLWQVPLDGTRTGTPVALFTGEFGRIRTVVAAPGGGLWITTSNRDGRGSPVPADDRVIELGLGS